MNQTSTNPDEEHDGPVDPVQTGAPATDPDEAEPPIDPMELDPVDRTEEQDDLTEMMSKQSFPTSDPPSTWAGTDHPKA